MRTHSDPTRRSSDRVREGKVAAERALWGRGRAAGRRLLPPGRCGRRQGEDQRDKPGGRKGFSYDPDHSQHERGKPPKRPKNAKTQKLPPEGETSDRATADAGANTMWGGRFASGPAAVMERINASIVFDRPL